MSVDREICVSPVFYNGRGAGHVVKMCVNTGDYGRVGLLTKLCNGVAHLLLTLARVDSNDALWPFNERLIR